MKAFLYCACAINFSHFVLYPDYRISFFMPLAFRFADYTLLEIMTILNFCIKKQVVLYSTKEGYVFQDDINSKVLGFAFGLMAEIERNLISMRTKEALARRKQEGMTLGRKKGDTPKIKLLHANKRVLTKELDKGTTYSELAEKMGVSRTTLFRFMKTMY